MTIHSPANAVAIEAQTRCWLEQRVLKDNLCPFAHQPYKNDLVRIIVTDSARQEYLLDDVLHELRHLASLPAETLETTLLIHPGVLEDFHDYNDFLDLVDGLLTQEGYEGVFQVASFHPDYQFADTVEDDAENYTNRSPWPMLHLLREASLEQAIASHPDVNGIPQRNIALMQEMGTETLAADLARCQNMAAQVE